VLARKEFVWERGRPSGTALVSPTSPRRFVLGLAFVLYQRLAEFLEVGEIGFNLDYSIQLLAA
jgi:hypothetical protein